MSQPSAMPSTWTGPDWSGSILEASLEETSPPVPAPSVAPRSNPNPTQAPTPAPSFYYHFSTHHGHRSDEPGPARAAQRGDWNDRSWRCTSATFQYSNVSSLTTASCFCHALSDLLVIFGATLVGMISMLVLLVLYRRCLKKREVASDTSRPLHLPQVPLHFSWSTAAHPCMRTRQYTYTRVHHGLDPEEQEFKRTLESQVRWPQRRQLKLAWAVLAVLAVLSLPPHGRSN